ncbi:MAG TPA: molybdopterin-dependent oxidoreductase, partial [Gemmatimonadaceae bacterium]|nr:molybdopterin-dependent oxidoreductase [Gemmatimonadaceae bacterium]
MSESNVKAGVKRREFLKVLGATTAAGTAAACGPLAGDKPEKLLPYIVSPDHTVPGVSNYYASTCRECAAGCGIIVETRDGRAIKIEGNPDHPVNHGALCARGQAALQGLYNPDRYRGPMQREGGTLKPITWDAAITLLSSKLAGARGKDAVFINQHEQGSFPAFLDQWLSALGLPAHISYDAEAPLAVLAANKEAYGTAWPSLDFAAAKLIVSIGADFLEGWGHSVTQQLSWADARAKTTDAPRAVYIGARRSLTGLNSDQWIAAKPGTELQVARALLGAVGKGAGVSLDGAANASGVPVAALEALGNALKAAGNRALVVAGTTGPDAKAVALAAAEINKALGSVGVTVKPADAMLGAERLNSAAQVREALERMKSGSVPVLMVRGANIAYTSPKQSDVAGALAKVPFKVAFTSYPDETAEMCDLILPDHHSLESWGDAETVKGVLSLQQPVMDPVFNTRATADVLIAVAKKDSGAAPKFAAQDYRAWIASRIGGDAALTAALPSGMKGGTGALASASVMAAPKTSSVANPQGGIGGNGDFTLQVYFSPVLGDGRGANKPWLQELPDPVTKVLWQTVIELHPDAAKKLGVAQGDHVTVKTAAGEITAPVYLYIGLRPDTVAVAAGRGHTAYGRYAKDCGANAFALLPSGEDETGGWALTQTRATVTNASGMSRIVTTEGAARQHDRGIAQAMNVGVLLGTEKDEEHGEPEFPGDSKHEFLPGIRAPVAGDAQGNLLRENSAQQGLYDPANPLGLTKRRWAMTIDLARCTGCSACVTACYAENNIPTVGAPWQGPKVLADRTG